MNNGKINQIFLDNKKYDIEDKSSSTRTYELKLLGTEWIKLLTLEDKTKFGTGNIVIHCYGQDYQGNKQLLTSSVFNISVGNEKTTDYTDNELYYNIIPIIQTVDEQNYEEARRIADTEGEAGSGGASSGGSSSSSAGSGSGIAFFGLHSVKFIKLQNDEIFLEGLVSFPNVLSIYEKLILELKICNSINLKHLEELEQVNREKNLLYEGATLIKDKSYLINYTSKYTNWEEMATDSINGGVINAVHVTVKLINSVNGASGEFGIKFVPSLSEKKTEIFSLLPPTTFYSTEKADLEKKVRKKINLFDNNSEFSSFSFQNIILENVTGELETPESWGENTFYDFFDLNIYLNNEIIDLNELSNYSINSKDVLEYELLAKSETIPTCYIIFEISKNSIVRYQELQTFTTPVSGAYVINEIIYNNYSRLYLEKITTKIVEEYYETESFKLLDLYKHINLTLGMHDEQIKSNQKEIISNKSYFENLISVLNQQTLESENLYGAFFNTSKVTLSAVKKITGKAITNCGMVTLKFENLSTIENAQISNCDYLTTVDFPSTLSTIIAASAIGPLFLNCESLNEIIFRGNYPTIATGSVTTIFSQIIGNGGVIYVPEEFLENYKAAWPGLANYIQVLSE